MGHCCKQMEEAMSWDLGIFPPEEDSPSWRIWIRKKHYYSDSKIYKFSHCLFCGKKLRGLKGRK